MSDEVPHDIVIVQLLSGPVFCPQLTLTLPFPVPLVGVTDTQEQFSLTDQLATPLEEMGRVPLPELDETVVPEELKDTVHEGGDPTVIEKHSVLLFSLLSFTSSR